MTAIVFSLRRAGYHIERMALSYRYGTFLQIYNLVLTAAGDVAEVAAFEAQVVIHAAFGAVDPFFHS